MGFLKISKQQAETIGYFEYKPQHFFDPYTREQKDGTFLVSTEVYEVLKDTDQFKKVDWTSVESTNETNDKQSPVIITR